MKVLVIGATGETGQRVVQRLRARGDAVRVLARSPERALATLGDDVEVHRGDVRDGDSLVGMARGCDAGVCCIGTRSYFGANGGAAVDAVGTRNVVTSLRADSLGHLVFLSAFGLDRSSIFLDIFSALLAGYFRWKAEAEAAVRTSGIPWTVVRPVELRNRPARSPALLNQQAPLGLLRTVSRELVAEVLVHCIGNPAAMEKTMELCEGGSGDLETQLRRLLPEAERPRPSRTPLLAVR